MHVDSQYLLLAHIALNISCIEPEVTRSLLNSVSANMSRDCGFTGAGSVEMFGVRSGSERLSGGRVRNHLHWRDTADKRDLENLMEQHA